MVQPHKLFYKGKEEDFIIFIEDKDLLNKYRNNDTTIPLIDLVSIYKVFTNRQGGSEGVLDEASKAELQNEFGTNNVDDAIKVILKEGQDKSVGGIHNGYNSHNDSMGPAAITN